jgi:YD repeat-containing protein
MVAIVSGNSLGLTLGSMATLGARGVEGNAAGGRSGEQAYVNAATGNLVLRDQDDSLVAHGRDVATVRTYNSLGKLNDDNADDWSIGIYAQQLRLLGTRNTVGSTLIRTDRDGAEATYTYDVSRNLYTSTAGAGAYDSIAYDSAASQYVWTDGSSGTQERYDSGTTGRLLSTKDTLGNTLTYGYNAAGLIASIGDASGETTFYDYSGNNLTQVRTVYLDAGLSQTLTRVHYTYDASNRLSSVMVDLSPGDNSIADGKAYTTTYTYDGTSRRVASVSQSDGTSLSFTYVLVGSDYRVASVRDGLGNLTTFGYDTAARRTTVTDPLSLATLFDYDAQGQLVAITGPAVAGVAPATTFAYDGNGNLTQTIDAEGRETDFAYDANGNQTYSRDAAGDTIWRTFDAHNQLLTESTYATPDLDGAGPAQPGDPQTTRYVYDAAGKNLLRFVVSPGGRVTEYRYNSYGERTSQIDYAAGTFDVSAYGRPAIGSVGIANVGLGAKTIGATTILGLYWDASAGTPAFSYRLAGTSTWSTLAVTTLSGTGYVDLSTLAAGAYEYTITYSAAGVTTAGASGTLTIDPVGQTGPALVAYSTVQTPIYGSVIVTPPDPSQYIVGSSQGTYGIAMPAATNGSDYIQTTGNVVTDGLDGDDEIDASYGGQSGGKLIGGPGNDWLNAANNSMTLDGGPGNDAYTSTGNNVHIQFGAGDGQDLIAWNASANKFISLDFKAGVNPADVVVRRVNDRTLGSNGALELALRGSSDKVTVQGFFPDQPANSVYNSLQQVTFADGTVGNFAQIAARIASSEPDEVYATSGNDNMVGTSGDDYLSATFYGTPGSGDDTLDGGAGDDLLDGGDGNNVYLFGRGDGHDTIAFPNFDQTPQSGVLRFKAGVAPGDLSFRQVAVNEHGFSALLVSIAGATDTVTIQSYFDAATINGVLTRNGPITAFQFADGTTWNQATIDAKALAGTSGNDRLYASGTQAIIAGGDGDDVLFSDTVDHTIQGGNGNDQIVSYSAHDVIDGGAGNDRITAQGDNATYLFGRGDGQDIVYRATNAGAQTLRFKAGVAPADIRVRHVDFGNPNNASYDLQLSIVGTTDSVQIQGYLRSGGVTYGPVSSFVFADGTTWTLADIESRVDTSARPVYGAPVVTGTDAYGRQFLAPGYVWQDNALVALPTTTWGIVGYDTSTVPVYGDYTVSLSGGPSELQMTAWLNVTPRTATMRTDYAYDGRGQLQTQTAYGSVDAAGNGVADSSQSVIRYVHDQAGLLLQTILPAGGSTSYTYDGLGRVIAAQDALANVTTTTYDDANAKTTVALVNGLATTSAYDKAGRLVSVTQSSASFPNLGQTRNWYDADSRLRMTQDPTGLRTWMLYDDDGHRIADIDATGQLTEYGYDRTGLLTRTIAYATPVATSGLVDAGGNPANVALAAIRPATAPTDHNAWRAYDAAGRLAKTVDASGAVVAYAYDGNSRLVQTTAFATRIATTVLSAHPSATQIAPAADPNDRTTRKLYDEDGLLVASLDGEGFLTENQYDAAGRLTVVVRYATAAPAVFRASGTLAQLRPAAIPGDQREFYLYNAKGQLVGSVSAENELTETVYDGDGNVARIVRYATKLSGVVAAGATIAQLRPASKSEDQVTVSVHDALDRLMQRTDPNGTQTRYAYDKVGNLLATTMAYGQPEARTLNARFDVQGRLVGELTGEGGAQLTGNQTQAQIDAVWARYGVSYAYDSAGRRISMTDQNAHTTFFYYDAAGRLTDTVNAAGEVSERQFDALGQLAATVQYGTAIATSGLSGGLVTPSLRNAIAAIRNTTLDSTQSYTYNASGTVATATDELGNVTTDGYDAFGELITQTLSLDAGVTRTDTVSYDRRGLAIAMASDATGINATTSSTYDAFGRPIRSVDANGRLTQRFFDRDGRLIQTTDAGNANRYTSYDAIGRVLTQQDATGAVTRYTYDTNQRTVTVTTPEGIAVTTTRTRFGQTQSVKDGKGQITSYGYDHDGHLTDTTTTLTTTHQAYDNAGRLAETIDARGIKVDYTYDAANRVLTRTVDPAGLKLETRYGYDAKGEQISVTDPNQTVTTTAFDLKGQTIRQIVDPGGLALKTTWAYDARGKVLVVTSPALTVTRYTFDKLGRRTQEQVDPSGLNITRKWSYDPSGNAVTSTDGNGKVSRYAYDALDRLAWSVDAAGDTTHVEYDAEGRVTRTTQYARPINVASLPTPPAIATTAQIQALVAATAGKDAVDASRYDRDGRLRFSVDGTGAVTEYRYDNNGNVKERVDYVNAIALAGWAGTSDPPVAADATRDRHSRTVYDALNRATYVADASGAVTQNVYDNNGNAVRQIGYATQIATTVAPNAVAASAADRISVFSYDAANRQTYSSDAFGAVTLTVYDADGNALKTTRFATLVTAGSNPGGIATSSALDRVTTRTFDKANRLTYSADGLRYVTGYTYDNDGRVKTTTRYATQLATGAPPSAVVASPTRDRTESSAYDLAGRVKLHTDAIGGTQGFSYDGLGHKLSFTNEKGSLWTYAYDAAGRLLTETTPQVTTTATSLSAGKLVEGAQTTAGIVTQLAYDGLGNLTSRTEAFGRTGVARTTSYAYDAVGRQIQVTYPTVGYYSESVAALATNGTTGLATRGETSTPLSSRTFYDAFGNAVANVDVAGSASFKAYDMAGRVAYEIDALGYVTGYVRDAFGGATSVTRYAAATALAGTTPASAAQAPTLAKVAATIGAAGVDHSFDRTITTTYDKLGRAATVTQPAAFVYDSTGETATTMGTSTALAAAQTANTYNAFGELTRVGQQKTAAAWLYTYNYYDNVGNQTATIDPAGNLTTKSYDAVGNLIGQTEYATALAAGSWSFASPVPPVSLMDDRTTVYTYDLANRKTGETRQHVVSGAANLRSDVSTSYGYDALGNLTKTTDALGSSTYSYYDALGRVSAVAAPSRSSTVGGAPLTPLTIFKRDAYGNVVVKIEMANSAVAASEFTGVSTPVSSGYTTGSVSADDHATVSSYDAQGHVTLSTDAAGASHYYSYNKLGQIAKTWQAVDDTYHTTKSTTTLFEAYNYDKLGRLTDTEDPAPPGAPGITDHLIRYDAFGDVVAKGVNGSDFEYFRYDNAGRLWASNAGDGVDRVFLYDRLGRQTSQLSSAGGADDQNLRSVASAADAVARPNTRRTDTVYDAAGHVSVTIAPQRSNAQNGVRAVTQANASAIISTAIVTFDESSVWSLSDSVDLSWSSLANLGSGDVSVALYYQTAAEVISPAYDEDHVHYPATYTPVIDKTISQTFRADQAVSGVNLTWATEQAGDPSGGIGAVTRFVVSKKDAQGNWQQVIDTASAANASTVEVAAAPDPSTAVQLQIRAQGSNGAWSNYPGIGINFGNAIRFGVNGLAAGTYDYRLQTTLTGQAARTSSSGTLAFTNGKLSITATGSNGDSVNLRPVVNLKADRWGNVVQQSDARNAAWITTYTYNANNEVLTATQPIITGLGAPITTHSYDALGQEIAVKDADGNLNAKAYDAGGNLLSESHADGGIVTYTYDAFGNKLSMTDADGNAASGPDAATYKANHTTAYAYDKLGRLVKETHGQVNVYSMSTGMVLSAATARNLTETYQYDAAGRKTRQVDGGGFVTDYLYDRSGNVVETRKQNLATSIVQASWDAFGHKTAEFDQNGAVAKWTYDYFGQLTGHTDIGGATYAYSYDNARQLIAQTNTRGQNLRYAYDAAGQLLTATDASINPVGGASLNQVTTYAYDLAGNHVVERTTQAGVVYQDNRLAYDLLGRLRVSDDGHVHMLIDYDLQGNRTHVSTKVNVATIGTLPAAAADDIRTGDRFYLYDAMNRQTAVDALDRSGSVGYVTVNGVKQAQGHRVAYDRNGNRTSDTYWGNRVTSTSVVIGYDEDGTAIYSDPNTTFQTTPGLTTETYAYDALDRLAGVGRDGVQVDLRFYDGSGNVLQTGPDGNLPTQYASELNKNVPQDSTIGVEQRKNYYDSLGRLKSQHVSDSASHAKYDIGYDAYDNAGNVLAYRLVNNAGTSYANRYTYTVARTDTYHVARIDAAAVDGYQTRLDPGNTVYTYDKNGNLIQTGDGTKSSNNHAYVNDLAGRVLQVTEGSGTQLHVEHQLVVSGQVLGQYGAAVDAVHPRSDGGDQQYQPVAEFNFGYQPINGNYPTASAGTYTVQAGDSLQSIAQGAYGDSQLWYRIAEANGLAGNGELRAGQTLRIPNSVGTVHNNGQTVKPYDPSRIAGDTTPNMPVPSSGGGGCGGLGLILVIVVAVAVTIIAPEIAPELFQAVGNVAGTIGVNALAAAVGDVAGQVVGNLVGVQHGFNFKELALSAVSGGVGGGLGGWQPLGAEVNQIANVAVRAAVSNAITQGIGVVTGLQRSFNWRSVAASAVGAGAGEAAGPVFAQAFGTTGAGAVATRFATSLASGTAAALMRGGRIVVTQIAADAFGNALGSSITEATSNSDQASAQARTDLNKFNRGNDAYYGASRQAPRYENWPNETNAESARLARYDSAAPESPDLLGDFLPYALGRPRMTSPFASIKDIDLALRPLEGSGAFDTSDEEWHALASTDASRALQQRVRDSGGFSAMGRIAGAMHLADSSAEIGFTVVPPSGSGAAAQAIRALIDPATGSLRAGVTQQDLSDVAMRNGVRMAVQEAGITNSPSQAYSMGTSLSQEYGKQGQDVLVLSAYNPTHGEKLDLVESLLVKNLGVNTATVEATRLLVADAAAYNAALANRLERPELGYTPVWGHSEGAAIATQALLSGVPKDTLANIDLRVLGSPVGTAPEGLHSFISVWNVNDPVAQFGRRVTLTGGVENSQGFIEGNQVNPDSYRSVPVNFEVTDFVDGETGNANHSLQYYMTHPVARSALALAPLDADLMKFYGHSYWRRGE